MSTETPATYHANRVVAFGLPRSFTPEQAKELFTAYGTVTKFRLRSGVARLQYETEESANAALALNSRQLEDRTLRCELELKKPQRKRTKKAAAPAEGAEAKPAKAARGPNPATVKIDGLVEGTTQDQVKAFVAGAGRVSSVRVLKSGSAALVTFEEESEATKALGLTGSALNGANVTISKDAGAPGRARAAAAPAAPAEPNPLADGKSIWVGALPEGSTEESLTNSFKGYGAVAKVQLKRGFAYITFETTDAANAAVAGNNGELKVQLATGGRARTAPAAGGKKRRVNRRRRAAPKEGAAEASA